MSEVAAILGDFHAPFHDEAAVDAALSVLSAVQPDALFLNGDLIDLHSISRFEKDPPDALKLQHEIDSAKGILQKLRAALPNAQLHLILGNHEARMRRFLARTPELWPLDCLRLDALLDLAAVECSLEEVGHTWNGWYLTHGDVVRAHAGQTAQAMLQKYGMCGVSNHVHRLAMVQKRSHSHHLTWIENACLCCLSPPYLTVADWQHGFTILEYDGDKVWPTLVPILDGECRFGGLTYPHTEAN